MIWVCHLSPPNYGVNKATNESKVIAQRKISGPLQPVQALRSWGSAPLSPTWPLFSPTPHLSFILNSFWSLGHPHQGCSLFSCDQGLFAPPSHFPSNELQLTLQDPIQKQCGGKAFPTPPHPTTSLRTPYSFPPCSLVSKPWAHLITQKLWADSA